MDGPDQGATAAGGQRQSQAPPMQQMSQPSPPPMGLVSPSQGGMGSHMNTKVGKFLLAAVVFGLTAVTLTSAGYDQSSWLNYKCTEADEHEFGKKENKENYDAAKKIYNEKTKKKSSYPSYPHYPVSCSEYHSGSFGCVQQAFYYDLAEAESKDKTLSKGGPGGNPGGPTLP